MPFNVLLLTGLLPDQTSLTESGVTVSVTRKQGETILFFQIDNPDVRKHMELKPEHRLCDLLVLYKKQGNERTVLCLVELKGSDLSTAVAQLAQTKTAVEQQLGRALQHLYVMRGCVIQSQKSSRRRKPESPREDKRERKQLADIFGKGNSDISRDSDISGLLRK